MPGVVVGHRSRSVEIVGRTGRPHHQQVVARRRGGVGELADPGRAVRPTGAALSLPWVNGVIEYMPYGVNGIRNG